LSTVSSTVLTPKKGTQTGTEWKALGLEFAQKDNLEANYYSNLGAAGLSKIDSIRKSTFFAKEIPFLGASISTRSFRIRPSHRTKNLSIQISALLILPLLLFCGNPSKWKENEHSCEL